MRTRRRVGAPDGSLLSPHYRGRSVASPRGRCIAPTPAPPHAQVAFKIIRDFGVQWTRRVIARYVRRNFPEKDRAKLLKGERIRLLATREAPPPPQL